MRKTSRKGVRLTPKVCASSRSESRALVMSVPMTKEGDWAPFDLWIILSSVVNLLCVTRTPPERWEATRVGDVADKDVIEIALDADVMEALRLLMSERHRAMLVVRSAEGDVKGLVTKTDILRALKSRDEPAHEAIGETV